MAGDNGLREELIDGVTDKIMAFWVPMAVRETIFCAQINIRDLGSGEEGFQIRIGRSQPDCKARSSVFKVFLHRRNNRERRAGNV